MNAKFDDFFYFFKNIIFHLMYFVCMFIANYLIFSILLFFKGNVGEFPTALQGFLYIIKRNCTKQRIWSKHSTNNSTNILIWSKHSTNWCGSIIWVPKLVIKVSNGFSNGETYIFTNGYNLTSFHVILRWTLNFFILCKMFELVYTSKLIITLCLP